MVVNLFSSYSIGWKKCGDEDSNLREKIVANIWKRIDKLHGKRSEKTAQIPVKSLAGVARDDGAGIRRKKSVHRAE